ncbi:MAG: S8 family serine peptidase [Thermoproteota archaeon]|nr:S8 family serine peptidase [Thermoproteota archaeon]
MKKSFLAIFVSLILSMPVCMVAVNSVVAEETLSYSEKALHHISQKYAVPPESLMLVNGRYANYPLSGRQIWRGKVLDLESHRVFGVNFDEAGDILDDLSSIEENEKLEYLTRYGKLTKDLHERLLNMAKQDTLKVGLWLKRTDELVAMPYRSANQTQFKEYMAKQVNACRLAEKSVIKAIRARGFNILYASKFAPVVFSELSKQAILEIENRLDVEKVFLSRTYKPQINTAADTERANLVWPYGIDGSGVKIAVVEDDGVAFANPHLADGSYFDSDNKRIDGHATAVAGVIASTNNTYRGIAHGAPGILSANAETYDSFDIMDATDWALNNSTRIINNSWGKDTGLEMDILDEYFDYVVRNYRVTVTVAAGNNRDPHRTKTGNVQSPGLGWNVITVGAIDDKDTSSWLDDDMAPYSSFKDPVSTNGDREKPEVVAVGNNKGNTPMYSTLTSDPWVGKTGNGTSLAAPAVAGEAALLMQTKEWLSWWPETVKATIMATAWHNIEGFSRLSMFDGAGAIDSWSAYRTVKNNQIVGEIIGSEDLPKSYTFDASEGGRVRVAIAWDSHDDVADELLADLDLFIWDSPKTHIITASASYDNSYEIVEFTAPYTGTYMAEVYPSRFDGDYEYLGFAWNQREHRLTIKAGLGGTTDPAPRTYTHVEGTDVKVTATPTWNGFSFSYWVLDGKVKYANPITVTIDSDHTLKAWFSPNGGGSEPCPTLFSWNGTDYVDYGVVDIHNPTGEDVVREVPILAEDVGVSNCKATFRLREGWEGLNYSESVIDQVKLYADGELCPLIKAVYSEQGNVLPQLLASDDVRVQMLLLETTDLTFIVPYQNVQSFTFVIEGCNMIKL